MKWPPGNSYLGKTSPCPSCPSFPFPQLHTSVRNDGRSASASPLYVGVSATVLILDRPTFLKSLGETLANNENSQTAADCIHSTTRAISFKSLKLIFQSLTFQIEQQSFTLHILSKMSSCQPRLIKNKI